MLMLRGLIEELRSQGHRALIFSQFTTHLALAREMLDAENISYRYLDGSLSEPRRRMEVDAFQSGEGDVFLISLRAGGTGLNLTGASYVIHLDPWWNPAVEDQAADRVHRIGQTAPVTIYRLVAKDTIEEAIVSLQEDKRNLVAAMLKGTDKAASMSVDELLELLSSQPPMAIEEEEPEDLMGAETPKSTRASTSW
jgi:SNF2 family DNA or RNA helicase